MTAWVRRYIDAILIGLLFVVLILAIWGWQKATNAQKRINTIEVSRTAEQAAEEKSKATGEVVLCFSTARTRPVLTKLLRRINASEPDPVQRVRVEILIQDYESNEVPGIKGQPTRKKCVAQARALHVDYSRYDFDPRTGRLLRRGEQAG